MTQHKESTYDTRHKSQISQFGCSHNGYTHTSAEKYGANSIRGEKERSHKKLKERKVTGEGKVKRFKPKR